jgi:iron complex transport system ATP-binding protein
VNFTGSVRVNDQEITHLSHRDFASLVAYVPQSPQFPAEMRAIDYVTMGRLPHLGYFAKENATDRLIAADLLERLGLGLMSLRTLETMSGGERQRLVLARALAQEAPVLLLDEPTSALDLGRRVEALELVDELRVEHDLTVISALHDLSLAAQFCEQLIMLANGVIVASGNAGDVLKADSLNQHFGTQVRVIRTEDGELVVVPRRTRPRGNNA